MRWGFGSLIWALARFPANAPASAHKSQLPFALVRRRSSELGDWFYSIAIFSFLLELTGSAQVVAFAFLMQVFPQTLAAPAAGVISDRLSRRQVMLFADWTRAAVVLSMLFVTGRGTLWMLFVPLFIETVMASLFEPARSSVIPNIAAPEDIIRANALSATTWSANFALGTALGGLVAAFAGREAVFVINALSFVLSAFLIRRMKFDEPHMEGFARLRFRDLFDFSPIGEGIRYVAADGRLFATMLLKSGLSLVGSNPQRHRDNMASCAIWFNAT